MARKDSGTVPINVYWEFINIGDKELCDSLGSGKWRRPIHESLMEDMGMDAEEWEYRQHVRGEIEEDCYGS